LLHRNLNCHLRPPRRVIQFREALQRACDANSPPLSPHPCLPPDRCTLSPMSGRAKELVAAMLAEHAEIQKISEKAEDVPMDEENWSDRRSLIAKALVDSRMWRILRSTELLEKSKANDARVAYLQHCRGLLQNKLLNVHESILSDLTENLHKTADALEVKVFFAKVRGDYHHYLAGVTVGSTKIEVIQTARLSYEKAMGDSKGLPTAHPLRLGVALEHAVLQADFEMSTGADQRANPGCAKEAESGGSGEDWYTNPYIKLQLLMNLLALCPHKSGECQ